MYSSVDLPTAILSELTGKKVLVATSAGIGQLKIEELNNLAKAGAIFLMEVPEEMKENQPAIIVTEVEEPPKKPLGGGVNASIPER